MNNVSMNSGYIAQSQNKYQDLLTPVSHWLLLIHQVDVKNSGVMSKLLGAGAVVTNQLCYV